MYLAMYILILSRSLFSCKINHEFSSICRKEINKNIIATLATYILTAPPRHVVLLSTNRD